MGEFAFSYASVRWQDFVDIALNSYILFRCYILFRDTNAFRVLIGITLFWIFQKISFSFGLIVTSWVLQGITAVGAVIVIVVFRNEIRSVLQVRNLKALLWDVHPKATRSPIGAVAEAVFAARARPNGLNRSRIVLDTRFQRKCPKTNRFRAVTLFGPTQRNFLGSN